MANETARFLSREARILTGVRELHPVPNPAAGNDIALTVPGGEQWRILAMHFTFTASAAVANRQVNWVLTVDSTRVHRVLDPTAITASGSIWYSLAIAQPIQFQNHSSGGGLLFHPDMWLSPGATFGTLTSNIDVGDQWSAVGLYVERYFLTNQQLGAILEDAIREYAQKAQVQSGHQ